MFALTRGQESQHSAGAQRGSSVISDVRRLSLRTLSAGQRVKVIRRAVTSLVICYSDCYKNKRGGGDGYNIQTDTFHENEIKHVHTEFTSVVCYFLLLLQPKYLHSEVFDHNLKNLYFMFWVG